MAQNITNDPAFKKKLEQMTPQMPRLNPETVESPTLDAIAQQTAREVGVVPQPAFDTLAAQPLNIAAATPAPVQVASAPMEGASQFNVPDPVTPQVEAPTPEPSVRDTIMGNLAESRFGQWLGGMETYPMKDGKIDRTAGTPVFPSIRAATKAEPFGSEAAPQVPTTELEATAVPDVTAEAATPANMATPTSVAGLSVTGTPMTPETITEAGKEFEGITTQSGEQIPTQQPTGKLKTYEDRLKETIAAGEMTPQMKAQAAAEASPSASPEQVAIAMKEDAERGVRMEADRAAEEFSSSLVGKGLPIAERERRVAEFKEKKLQEGIKGMDKPKTAEEVKASQQAEEARNLEIERKKQIIERGKRPDASPFEKKRSEWVEREEDLREAGVRDEEIVARRMAFMHGDKFEPWRFENAVGEESEPPATPAEAAEAEQGNAESVRMIDNEGRERDVPAKDKEAALKAGYTIK